MARSGIMVGGPRDGTVVSPLDPNCDQLCFPLDGESGAWLVYDLRKGVAKSEADERVPFDFSYAIGAETRDGYLIKNRSPRSGPAGRSP